MWQMRNIGQKDDMDSREMELSERQIWTKHVSGFRQQNAGCGSLIEVRPGEKGQHGIAT